MDTEAQKAIELNLGLQAVLPFLMIPIAISSASRAIYFANKSKNWRETLPLILIQLNTIFIWCSMECLSVGYLREVVSDQQ